MCPPRPSRSSSAATWRAGRLPARNLGALPPWCSIRRARARAIATSSIPVVVAVSCDPTTLARDLRVLCDGGYAIERIVPIDQFLWSPRIEAAAVLRK